MEVKADRCARDGGRLRALEVDRHPPLVEIIERVLEARVWEVLGCVRDEQVNPPGGIERILWVPADVAHADRGWPLRSWGRRWVVLAAKPSQIVVSDLLLWQRWRQLSAVRLASQERTAIRNVLRENDLWHLSVDDRCGQCEPQLGHARPRAVGLQWMVHASSFSNKKAHDRKRFFALHAYLGGDGGEACRRNCASRNARFHAISSHLPSGFAPQ